MGQDWPRAYQVQAVQLHREQALAARCIPPLFRQSDIVPERVSLMLHSVEHRGQLIEEQAPAVSQRTEWVNVLRMQLLVEWTAEHHLASFAIEMETIIEEQAHDHLQTYKRHVQSSSTDLYCGMWDICWVMVFYVLQGFMHSMFVLEAAVFDVPAIVWDCNAENIQWKVKQSKWLKDGKSRSQQQ